MGGVISLEKIPIKIINLASNDAILRFSYYDNLAFGSPSIRAVTAGNSTTISFYNYLPINAYFSKKNYYLNYSCVNSLTGYATNSVHKIYSYLENGMYYTDIILIATSIPLTITVTASLDPT